MLSTSTFLTSWKVSSYWPPSSLTIVSLLVFSLCLQCLLKIVLTLWLWTKEVVRLSKWFLLRHKTLILGVVGRASTYKRGQLCDSTATDTPPTILSYPQTQMKDGRCMLFWKTKLGFLTESSPNNYSEVQIFQTNYVAFFN